MNKNVNTLPYVEINPNQPARGCVIWLHGLGADGHDFVPLVPALQLENELPLRFIFPHAPSRPITFHQGYIMPAWYDIISIEREKDTDHAGILQTVEWINQLILQEKNNGFTEERMILAGFSQGAVIALTTALKSSKRLGGVIALSGYLPSGETLLQEASNDARATPIFLAHGKQDSIVPYAMGVAVSDLLNKYHAPLEWHSYDMDHSVCQEEVRDIATWLKKTIQT